MSTKINPDDFRGAAIPVQFFANGLVVFRLKPAEAQMSVTAFKSKTLPQDIEQIFNEHHIFVYKVAYHILGNRQEAEDVVQTIFLRLLGRDRPPDIWKNPRAYLYRSAVNIAIN